MSRLTYMSGREGEEDHVGEEMVRERGGGQWAAAMVVPCYSEKEIFFLFPDYKVATA